MISVALAGRVNIALSVLMLFSFTAHSQTIERSSAESKENFIRRVMPVDATIEQSITEHKFNSPGKKLIYFYKKLDKDSSGGKSKEIICIHAGILIPESETSKKYSQQTLFVDCNSDFNCNIESTEVKLNKKTKNYELNISFVQLNRASTRLILKTYKTFLIKQATDSGSFTIVELKE